MRSTGLSTRCCLCRGREQRPADGHPVKSGFTWAASSGKKSPCKRVSYNGHYLGFPSVRHESHRLAGLLATFKCEKNS